MAPLNHTITVEFERRLCKVDDRIGYFHCWEHYADVIAPGLTGGQYPLMFGVVEFKDGLERVDLSRIKFIDAGNAALYTLNQKETDI